MSTLHIYDCASQPAHSWFIDIGDPTVTPYKPRSLWVRHSPHALAWCRHCKKRRRLRNMRVKVYYDDVRYFCTEHERGQR